MFHLDRTGLASASIYQIFARNFTPEGRLDSAISRLPGVRAMGFDFVYLCPIHPVGEKARKGSLGSPYAIADFRRVDPLLGGEGAFRAFLDAAHSLGMGVIMDVVYNHSSPDSVLAREHPEWFWKDPRGEPGPRVTAWSDVADFDYAHRGLREYLIESLERWVEFGADGFRCDVASLVPLDFWIEARARIAGTREVLWLAESVHKEFVIEARRRGFYAASDPELHRAFDLSYDYDGREELEAAWRGEASLGPYLGHLRLQESLYPAGSLKLRFLENHDQPRAASRFGRGERLRAWTAFAMLLPGTFMAYMGQELALEKGIGLFDREPMDEGAGDGAFREFFSRAHIATKGVRALAPICETRLLAEGLVLLLRGRPDAAGGLEPVYAALLNLDGRSGRFPNSCPSFAGVDILGGGAVGIEGGMPIPSEALILELGK
jgi:glycosidase